MGVVGERDRPTNAAKRGVALLAPSKLGVAGGRSTSRARRSGARVSHYTQQVSERGRTTDFDVDVGIPTAGRISFLRQTIESVLSQTVERWRLWISESTPGQPQVRELLEPYLADERIRHLPAEKQLNQAENHTRLVNQARAEAVAILHDDDTWDPGFLERRLRFLQAHPACGFVFGGYKAIDDSGHELGRTAYSLAEGVHEPSDWIPRLLRYDPRPLPPSVLVRRSAYEVVGPYWESRFPSASDWELWLRLSIHFPVGYVDVCDASYRIHTQQETYSEFWGAGRVEIHNHVDSLLAGRFDDLIPTGRRRARRSSRGHLAAAADFAESGDSRRFLSHLAAGVRAYPPALLDLRLLSVLAAVLLGARGRRLLARHRAELRRHDYLSEVQLVDAGRNGVDAAEKSVPARALHRLLDRRTP